MSNRTTMQQALELIERLNMRGWILADFEDEVYATLNSLKAALEQPPLPVQEPTPWRDMIVVTLVREGINKHKARELADHFAAQPVQEPVGEVVEVNNDGFRCEFNRRLAVGTKLYIAPEQCRTRSTASRASVQPEPLEYWNAVEGWVKIDEVRKHFDAVSCGTIYKHGGEGRVPLYTAPPQQQAEPVAWDKPSDNFNEWWDGDRRRDTANPFTTDSFAYWAWEGWQAALAQSPWVGLTEDEKFEMAAAQYGWEDLLIAAEARLKEKNNV